MQARTDLWHPDTECAEGDPMILTLDGVYRLGEVEIADLCPEQWPGACVVRAREPLMLPDGHCLAQGGACVVTPWDRLLSRDEDLAVVEAYWLLNGCTPEAP